MALPTCSDQEFIELWQKLRSPTAVAQKLGVALRNVQARRDRLMKKYDVDLTTITERNTTGSAKVKPLHLTIPEKQARITAELDKGIVIVFSDAHFWGERSVAFEALLNAIQGLRPKMIIANGDVFDGAGAMGRHPRIGWDQAPTGKQQLQAVQDALGEIEDTAKGAKLLRTIGNHDIRFESKLSNNVAEYEGIHGFTLRDHLPRWHDAWSIMINGNTMVKHRYHNGIHAAFNNTLKAGTNIVTGHLHRLLVTPWGDYNGRRYGVDTGCLADPHGEQFTYAEDNPSPHCAGFAVLTYREGKLLPPELCEVIEGKAYFRGYQI